MSEFYPGRFEHFKKHSRQTITEYARSNMNTFRRLPFGPVDSLILSQMCYMNLDAPFGDCRFKKAGNIKDLYKAEYFGRILEGVRDPESNEKLLKTVCASPRYRDIEIGYFENRFDRRRQEQFFAMTFFLPDGTAYASFRGTDASVIGWKEDFNMLFSDCFPGWERAVEYLDSLAENHNGKIIAGGHSKGGSLAVYRAAFCKKETFDRVTDVYNHDGPGLGRWAREAPEKNDTTVKERLTLPRESMIGVIFNDGNYTVVESNRSGVMQHDPFSWLIEDDGFIIRQNLKKASGKVDETVRNIMKDMPAEERKLTIDTVFSLIESAGSDSFSDWLGTAVKNPEKLISAVKGLGPDTAARTAGNVAKVLAIAAKTFLGAEDEKEAETACIKA